MTRPRILFSMPTRHHVEIALDEMEGLHELGYACSSFPYAARDGVSSKLGRLKVIWQNALQLVRIARQFQPDIIYFNSRLEALAGMRDVITILICKVFYRRPVKFVLKSHGSDLTVLKRRDAVVSKIILPYLHGNISGWLFLSSQEQYLISQSSYLDPENVFVTKNIVRTGQFRKEANFRQKFNIPEEYTILLFVGRLIPEKGIYDALKAFAEIKDRYRIVFLIVGWGSEEAALKQLCNELGIADQVIFTGFVPEQEVIPFYANSDVLVFPTYFPEGFPMALFNSVAAGLAVITTKIRAAADYLHETENCLWVTSQDIKSIADALETLLQTDGLMAQMKQNNLLAGRDFGKAQVSKELAVMLETIFNR